MFKVYATSFICLLELYYEKITKMTISVLEGGGGVMTTPWHIFCADQYLCRSVLVSVSINFLKQIFAMRNFVVDMFSERCVSFGQLFVDHFPCRTVSIMLSIEY